MKGDLINMTTKELYAYYTDKNEAMEIFGDPEEQYENMAFEYRIQEVLLKAKEYDEEQREQFEDLCRECRDKGFTKSSEVSRYIKDNKLGNKYDLISGKITFDNDNVLEGGISPKCYGRLCRALALVERQTYIKPKAFESYRELNHRQASLV